MPLKATRARRNGLSDLSRLVPRRKARRIKGKSPGEAGVQRQPGFVGKNGETAAIHYSSKTDHRFTSVDLQYYPRSTITIDAPVCCIIDQQGLRPKAVPPARSDIVISGCLQVYIPKYIESCACAGPFRSVITTCIPSSEPARLHAKSELDKS
jgi:hypothetical protein